MASSSKPTAPQLPEIQVDLSPPDSSEIPMGISVECPGLWEFAKSLTPDREKLLQKENGLKPFLFGFLTTLKQSLSFESRLPVFAPGNAQITGSVLNGVALDQSDFDVIIPMSGTIDAIVDGPDKWVWNGVAITPAFCSVLCATIDKAVETFLIEHKSLGFALKSQNKTDTCRYTFKKDELEFDLLFSFDRAGYKGILERSKLTRSDNQIGVINLTGAATGRLGFHPMIRVLKLIGYGYRKKNPHFHLASATFESAMYKYVGKDFVSKWNDTSFYDIFRGCLKVISDALDQNLKFSPMNDTEANLLPSEAVPRKAVYDFIKQWLSVGPKDLLTELKLVKAACKPLSETHPSSTGPPSPVPPNNPNHTVVLPDGPKFPNQHQQIAAGAKNPVAPPVPAPRFTLHHKNQGTPTGALKFGTENYCVIVHDPKHGEIPAVSKGGSAWYSWNNKEKKSSDYSFIVPGPGRSVSLQPPQPQGAIPKGAIGPFSGFYVAVVDGHGKGQQESSFKRPGRANGTVCFWTMSEQAHTASNFRFVIVQ